MKAVGQCLPCQSDALSPRGIALEPVSGRHSNRSLFACGNSAGNDAYGARGGEANGTNRLSANPTERPNSHTSETILRDPS